MNERIPVTVVVPPLTEDQHEYLQKILLNTGYDPAIVIGGPKSSAERMRIAQIIDPDAWTTKALGQFARRQDAALIKADQIMNGAKS